jgi:hypothetical protein
MDKIVILGLGKSGTMSASSFFQNMGFKCIHWVGSDIDINNFIGMSKKEILEFSSYLEEKYEVFSDYPYCMSYEYFDKKYKDTYFILITRNIEDWCKSIRKHDGLSKFNPLRIACWSQYLNVENKGIIDLSDNDLKHIYSSHTKDVFEYFKDSKNFIHIDLNDENKKDKILNFLNIKLNTNFPKINITDYNK